MVHSKRQTEYVSKVIESFHPDIIHVHNVYPSLGPAVHLAADRMRIPLVMTVHNYRLRCPNGFMFTEGELCRRCEKGNYTNAVIHRCFPSRKQAAAYAGTLWAHRFLSRLENRVKLFLAPSEYMLAQLRHWGIEASRSKLLRNFVPAMGDLTPTGNFGVFIGRLSPEKGIDVLLHALALANDPPFQVIGDGPSRSQLQNLAQALGLSRLVFSGQLAPNEVQNRLEHAAFLVMPSVWQENAPLAALEAMAVGRPLIVSDMGGLPELARDGRGFICPPGEPMPLANAIRQLTSNRALADGMGATAHQFAETHLSPGGHLAKLGSIYEAVRS